MRCAIYARYSSEEQREASIDDQVRRCRQYIERHGGAFDESLVFADRAMSGASADRPKFTALSSLATSVPPLVDVIITEDLSRIGRDQADLHHFRRSLEYSRVRLIGIADGIDTAAAHGSLTFSMKGIIAEIYLKDLRDKTLRGLEGRALAKYATGGVAYGFRLRRETGPDGRAVGSVIEVDEQKAQVVRRIFRLYLEGNSLSTIARLLTREAVPPPRVHVEGRRKGWKDSTIRAFLHNTSYFGHWTYKEREWRKVPGTNKRRPARRRDEEVMKDERPHLRIVDADTWLAVQERLEAVRRAYNRKNAGPGRTIPNRRSSYLFSSLLYCGVCGSKMIICGGSSASYYRCEGNKKRGICNNALSVREDLVRESILGELRRRLLREDSLKEARAKMSEWLGGVRRRRDSERNEVLTRMEKNNVNAERLVDGIADGTLRSADVGGRLAALRNEVEADRKLLATLEHKAFAPISLPTPKDVVQIVADMEARLRADPNRGRVELHHYFEDGRIDLIPKFGRFYVARSKFLPLVPLMAQTPSEALGLGGRYGESRSSAISCAGANETIATSVELPYVFVVPAPPDRRRTPGAWKRRAA